jgi:hypothetical protein
VIEQSNKKKVIEQIYLIQELPLKYVDPHSNIWVYMGCDRIQEELKPYLVRRNSIKSKSSVNLFPSGPTKPTCLNSQKVSNCNAERATRNSSSVHFFWIDLQLLQNFHSIGSVYP